MQNHSLHNGDGLIPEGAIAELQDLQRLRYLAWPFIRSQYKARTQLAGKHQSQFKSRGMEFDEVRLYQQGDDVRTIDWRVTARTQTTHTKSFQEEKEKAVITMVDQRSPMLFGSSHAFKSVTACYLAALINWATMESGDRCGGLLLGHSGISDTRPARSHRTINQWLHGLCEANKELLDTEQKSLKLNQLQQQEPSFTDALLHLKNSVHQNSEIIVISDFSDLNKECDALLYALSRKHQLSFQWIIDPMEAHLPLAGQANFSDGLQQQSLNINKGVQYQLHLYFQQKAHYLQQVCKTFGIRLQARLTDQDLLKPVDISFG